MTPEDFDYARMYSGMVDDELLQVARDYSGLVDAAKTALDKELDKRGLKYEPEHEPAKVVTVEGPESAYCPNCDREVSDPLTCGECSSVICRLCGTALKMPWDVEGDEAESQVAG